jgi:Iap family predicted aminopeptidase
MFDCPYSNSVLLFGAWDSSHMYVMSVFWIWNSVHTLLKFFFPVSQGILYVNQIVVCYRSIKLYQIMRKEYLFSFSLYVLGYACVNMAKHQAKETLVIVYCIVKTC